MRQPLLAALLCVLTGAAHAQADFVVHNAHIYTMEEARPRAQALAVGGGRILEVGTDAAVLAAFPDARRIDVAGRTVIPGLIDAHAHLMGRGLAMLQVDLVGTASISDVVSRLQQFEERLPPRAWLIGRGWDQNDWPEQRFPTRHDLDQAFPDRPVWLERVDGHAHWANTAALRAAGLDVIRAASDPQGGAILRDESGEPTGVFVDAGSALVSRHVPEPSQAERTRALQLVLEETARYGLTGVHDAGIDSADVALYRAAVDRGEFDLRVYAMASGSTFERLCRKGLLIGYGDRLTLRSVKFYADGALGSRGAALLEPYADDQGNEGLLRFDADAFLDRIERAMSCGLQVNTHAIGDRANRIVLDTYERALMSTGGGPGRHRIEHAQIVDPSDIPRFAGLGIIASVQPTHATSDMYWAEARLGAHRLEGAYAWRTFREHGIRIAFGSDFPVESVDPLRGFYAAVTRTDESGWPDGGWRPHERLTRTEVLRAFTIDAAYASFQEDEIGSLAVGKRADFVVLSHDIMTVPAGRLLDARVLETYLDGHRIYAAVDESNMPR